MMSRNTLDMGRERGMHPRNPVSRLFGATSGSLRTTPCARALPLLSIIWVIELQRACFDLGCCARDIKYTMNRQQDGFVLWAMRHTMRNFVPAFACRMLLFHVKQYKLRFSAPYPRMQNERKRASQQAKARQFLNIVTRIEVFCLRVWAMRLVLHDVTKPRSDPRDHGFVIVEAPGAPRRRHKGAQRVKT